MESEDSGWLETKILGVEFVSGYFNGQGKLCEKLNRFKDDYMNISFIT